MNRRLPVLGILVAAALFVADQLAKLAIARMTGLFEYAPPRVVTSFFSLRFVANRGVSLGLLPADGAGTRWLLVAGTLAIAGGVAWWMAREPRRLDQAALGAILGGAIGNIIDRVRYGFVIDYADLHLGSVHFLFVQSDDWRPFLVFNLADAAITIGVVVLLVRALFVRDKPPASSEIPHA